MSSLSWIYNRQIIMYQVKADPIYFRISSVTLNQLTPSGYDDVTKTLYKSVWRKSWILKKTMCGFTILNAKDSAKVPWKSTRNWNMYMEYLLVHTPLFVGGSDVFKAARKTSEINHISKHQNLPWTKIPSSDEEYKSCSSHLTSWISTIWMLDYFFWFFFLNCPCKK